MSGVFGQLLSFVGLVYVARVDRQEVSMRWKVMSIAVVEFCLSVMYLFLQEFCSLRKSGPQNYDWVESWWNTLSIGRRRYLLRVVYAWGVVADAVAIERRSLEDVCSLRLMVGRRYVR